MTDENGRPGTTAELHDDFMQRTGSPPALKDMIDLRKRQAQQTHLQLHDRVLSGKKPSIAFVKKIFTVHDMVWTLWGGADAGIGWDIVQGKALLDKALAPGSPRAGPVPGSHDKGSRPARLEPPVERFRRWPIESEDLRDPGRRA